MQQPELKKPLQVILIIVFGIAALYFARPFLVPVCFAGLLAMLFLPLSRKLQRAGLKKGLAAVVCVLIFLIVIGGIIALITWQVTNLIEDLGNIEGKIKRSVEQLKDYVSKAFGMSHSEQEEAIEKQTEKSGDLLSKLGLSLMDVVVNFILVIVYIFLFLYYRSHIKTFILKILPKKDDAKADSAIDDIEKVSQKYVTGLGLMIVCLWIMYGIGFSIVGLKNGIFFAILCGLFEIVPFVGNLMGNLLAVLMAVTQGGGMSMVIGILITYGIVQFLQTYILEPLVVGNEVNINPLFTIMGLVAGELLWGIPGLILAIPLLGIVKIICDHIPALQPYGFLIGREKSSNPGLADKIKSIFKKDK